MGLDELHSVQEDLMKKLATTSNLIESRSRSVSKDSASCRSGVAYLESAQKLREKLPTF